MKKAAFKTKKVGLILKYFKRSKGRSEDVIWTAMAQPTKALAEVLGFDKRVLKYSFSFDLFLNRLQS